MVIDKQVKGQLSLFECGGLEEFVQEEPKKQKTEKRIPIAQWPNGPSTRKGYRLCLIDYHRSNGYVTTKRILGNE
mgnify:CR=1 FL=1